MLRTAMRVPGLPIGEGRAYRGLTGDVGVEVGETSM